MKYTDPFKMCEIEQITNWALIKMAVKLQHNFSAYTVRDIREQQI